jgi:two-component system sensor histidine kinase TctE
LRLRDVTTVDGITGVFTVTVWQHTEVRDALMRDLARRAFTVMAILIGTVAFVVWFGVRIGLLPLTDLEDAISRRSSDDLSSIRRPVPPEIRGLVLRLNTLFGQLQTTMARQAEFVSNAAHQLRNPIAGVLAMAEAVRSAPTEQAARARADELMASALHIRDLANKLLTLERATVVAGHSESLELGELVEDVADRFRLPARTRGVTLALTLPEEEVIALADRVMLSEALVNLLDNALLHGGPAMKRIAVTLSVSGGQARITVADDGRGVAPGDIATVLSRFGQAGPSQGSGLGLSIAEAVAQNHGGTIDLGRGPEGGLQVTLTLPLAARAPLVRQAAE